MRSISPLVAAALAVSMTEARIDASNLSTRDIRTAYTAGCRKVKFNLVKDFCNSYEDSLVPLKHIRALEALGFPKDSIDEYGDDKHATIDPDSYLNIYLFVVKLGNPKFEYIRLKGKSAIINIGGYGCYHG